MLSFRTAPIIHSFKKIMKKQIANLLSAVSTMWNRPAIHNEFITEILIILALYSYIFCFHFDVIIKLSVFQWNHWLGKWFVIPHESVIYLNIISKISIYFPSVNRKTHTGDGERMLLLMESKMFRLRGSQSVDRFVQIGRKYAIATAIHMHHVPTQYAQFCCFHIKYKM